MNNDDDSSENSDSDKEEIIFEEENESSEIDEDQPTLIQINKKINKKRKEEDMKTLLKRKKKFDDKCDIVYDANKKKIIGCYCPDPKELNDFLNNCVIREIKDDEILSENIQQENIFDPQEFIRKNYKNENYKGLYSLEELSLDIEKISLDEEKPILVEQEKYIPQPKIEDRSELIKSILNSEILNVAQKREFNKLISEIKKMDIKNIIKNDKNDKLDIVFDLDNTCIVGFPIKPNFLNLKKEFPEKNIKIFSFEFRGKILYFSMIIRRGLKEFINFSKPFCNFHISTLGAISYGEEIKRILEDYLGIKFLRFKGNNGRENKKFLQDLGLNSKNSIIFDDQPSVWAKDNLNVILSKKFTDEDCSYYFYKKENNEKIYSLENFLSNYLPFYYYKFEKNEYNQIKINSQKIYGGRQCPFYHFIEKNNIKENECYFGECCNTTKKQFIYMKDVIKIIYYFVFNYDICVFDVIKLIRYNIFYKTYFSLKFYKGEGIEILQDTIECCGGEIINEEKINQNINNKIFFICRKKDYSSLEQKIKKELILYENSMVVSEKYVLDSFYFMTNLENELKEPEYSFSNGEEDQFDNY